MIYYFYKIVCEDLPNYIYVGSTRALAERKRRHKCDCNNENYKAYNCKLYKTIRQNGGWDNWRFVCIHQGEYPDKRAAEIKEEELRLELNGNMNSHRCHITTEQRKEYKREYREQNKEYFNEYSKEYREANKEQINEKMNKKFECECGGRYTYVNKTTHERTKKHQNYLKENVND